MGHDDAGITDQPPLPEAVWQHLPPAARELILQLVARIAELGALVSRLEEENRELKARLGQNSSNSSLPPSSDGPQAPPRRPLRPESERRRGGQPGHKGRSRKMVPSDQVDAVIDHWPSQCRACQTLLLVGPEGTVGDPIRHQVTELPPITARVTEHRQHRVRCPACGTTTLAELPEEVPTSAFGPRLQAAVAALSARFRLSRREVVELCTDLFGIDLSVGSVQAMCQRTSRALAPVVGQLEAEVRAAPMVNSDETSWKEDGQKSWLWGLVAQRISVFRIAPSRGADVLRGLLGEAFGGIVGSDRWSAYKIFEPERRQVCWAHLKRNFQALVDRGGTAQGLGEWALREVEHLFDAWHRWQRGEITREALRRELVPVQMRLKRLLQQGTQNPDRKARSLSRNLLRLWPALFTFLRHDGVEPTNNAAERALRPAVLWRKGSFGTRSPEGSRFVERMMTLTMTCRLQGLPLVEVLTAACATAAAGQRPSWQALHPARPP